MRLPCHCTSLFTYDIASCRPDHIPVITTVLVQVSRMTATYLDADLRSRPHTRAIQWDIKVRQPVLNVGALILVLQGFITEQQKTVMAVADDLIKLPKVCQEEEVC